MVKKSKADALNFVADLACPVGPEVYAGFGSAIQKQLANDPMCVYDIVETWLSEFNLLDLEPILLDIASGVDIPDSFESIRDRFKEDWDFVVTTLIYEAFNDDDAKFWEIVLTLEQHKLAKRIASDLRVWKEEAEIEKA